MLIVVQSFLVRLISYSLTFKCWGSTAVVLLAVISIQLLCVSMFMFSNSMGSYSHRKEKITDLSFQNVIKWSKLCGSSEKKFDRVEIMML